MKKKPIYILLLLALCACNKPGSNEQQPYSVSDSLLSHALQAIFDPSLSCLDAKDEIMILLDTMQSHVESCPDEQIRIGARSLALEIVGMFVYNDSITPEEEQFFEDSLLFPLIDIQHTWYCPSYVPKGITNRAAQPVLLQEVVFRDDKSNENRVIKLEIFYHPDNTDLLLIELPKDAETLLGISFLNDSTKTTDTTCFYTVVDAIQSTPQSEECGPIIVYDQNLIYDMLTHNHMFIEYLDEIETEDLKDRWHSAHLSLNKFHEQFYPVLQMLESQKSVMNVISNTQYDEDGNHSAWAGHDWVVFTYKGDKMFASGTLITPSDYDFIYSTIKDEFGEPTYSTRDFVLDPDLAESDTDMFDLARWEDMRDINYWCNDSLVICCSFMFLDSMGDGGYYSYLTIDQLNVKQPETHVSKK